MSLAAYLAEFADIIGKGSVELFERLAAAVADRTNNDFRPANTTAIALHLYSVSPRRRL